MKHAEGSFIGAGRLNIYRQSWLPTRAPRAVVVIAHGLGEHSGRYRHVAAALVRADFAVYAMDHRGHGRSGGPRAYVDRWQNAVVDMDEVVNLAARAHAGKPLFLLGHSMGGALSLGYALSHQHKLDGLMLSGPAVALDGAPPGIGPVAKLLGILAPRLGLFGIDPSVVSRDPEAAAGYAADPLNCHGKVPARTLSQIVRLAEFLPKALPQLKLPLLIQHGGDDKLAGVAGSRMVISKVSSTDKTLEVYDGLYHEIFNELPPDRARVFDDLKQWLASHVTAVGAKKPRRTGRKT